MPRILVVDDEKNITDTIAYRLKREGYEVDTAYDGEEALILAEKNKPDLLVLDLMMPKQDGLSVCKQLAAGKNSPSVLILTARESEIDKVLGLEMGADDYLTKPFGMGELLARIKALLRRKENFRAAAKEGNILVNGELTIDETKRKVFLRGREVEMALKEFDLLLFLMENAGRTLTRSQILGRVWEGESLDDDRKLDVHIRWLREKIENDPSRPFYIKTIRGYGYKMERQEKR